MVAVHQAHHETTLRGAWSPDTAKGPLLIQRTDEDFVTALLGEMDSADAETTVTAQRLQPAAGQNYLRLFQPVHRTFTLALLEARCEVFGFPRLDPRKIESAGLVVRRVAEKDGQPLRDAHGRYVLEGWRNLGKTVAGWVPFPQGGVTTTCDPVPDRRCGPRFTGNAEVDRGLRPPVTDYAEVVSPLFPAPPDVSAKCGHTVLFGVVPVTSSARAGQPDAAPPAPANAAAWESGWQEHLSPLLKATGARTLSWPYSTLTPPTRDNLATLQATEFFVALQQLAQEFGAFKEGSATATAILRELDKLQIKLADDTSRAAGQYLKAAAKIVIEGESASPAPPAPKTWPAIGSSAAAALDRALKASVEAARKALLAAPGRFDEPGRLYVVQGFIRVRQPDPCPAKIVWSDPTPPFQIAPWHEPGPVAPAPILLPDLTRDALKKATPGVLFSVPKELFNLLRGKPKDLLDGNGSTAGFSLDWICGFNIPIITICAFILLNIILAILNIIFWWLPFVKICIPFPRKKA